MHILYADVAFVVRAYIQCVVMTCFKCARGLRHCHYHVQSSQRRPSLSSSRLWSCGGFLFLVLFFFFLRERWFWSVSRVVDFMSVRYLTCRVKRPNQLKLIRSSYKIQNSSYKIDVDFSMPNCRGVSEKSSCEV